MKPHFRNLASMEGGLGSSRVPSVPYRTLYMPLIEELKEPLLETEITFTEFVSRLRHEGWLLQNSPGWLEFYVLLVTLGKEYSVIAEVNGLLHVSGDVWVEGKCFKEGPFYIPSILKTVMGRMVYHATRGK